MKCPEVKKRLKAFMDGELAIGEDARIRSHLAACSDCLEELHGLSQTWSLLGELPALNPGPDFISALLRKVEGEEGEGTVRSFLKRLIQVPTPAIAVVVLIVGLFLGGKVGSFLSAAVLGPRPGVEAGDNGEVPFYQEIFADLSPHSLESVYLDSSDESERNGRS